MKFIVKYLNTRELRHLEAARSLPGSIDMSGIAKVFMIIASYALGITLLQTFVDVGNLGEILVKLAFIPIAILFFTEFYFVWKIKGMASQTIANRIQTLKAKLS